MPQYDPSKRDPQYANGEYAMAWSLTLLAKHYHPTVQAFTKQLLTSLSGNIDNIVYVLWGKKAQDYEKAKIPMLPITNGIEDTKKNIFIYSLLMLPTVVLPYAIGFTSELFLTLGLTLTIYYNYLCFKLYNYKKNKFESTCQTKNGYMCSFRCY